MADGSAANLPHETAEEWAAAFHAKFDAVCRNFWEQLEKRGLPPALKPAKLQQRGKSHQSLPQVCHQGGSTVQHAAMPPAAPPIPAKSTMGPTWRLTPLQRPRHRRTARYRRRRPHQTPKPARSLPNRKIEAPRALLASGNMRHTVPLVWDREVAAHLLHNSGNQPSWGAHKPGYQTNYLLKHTKGIG
ncbi:Hypothetical predicted protein [Pelobates cultripes]|uniref:Uncharacterized protein n=1 Tax=Pelobates cultripes TaxID=61616 RepID=A0AAD1SKB9_PELCU|nr:Hypothetical predicted protein [Pelobates cultripes]